jgi:hypothetical protein
MVAGQIEDIGERRNEILHLNLGPPEILNVAGNFAVTRTIVVVNGNDAKTYNIFGGQEGDLLLLRGDGVELQDSGGNLILESKFKLKPFKLIILYFENNNWSELLRT